MRGQSGNTRSQSLCQQTTAKIDAIAACYRHNRAAYHSLKGDGDSELNLRKLNAQDVRPLSDSHIIHEAGSKALREGKKMVSWIWWASLSPLASNDELDEGKSSLVGCTAFPKHLRPI